MEDLLIEGSKSVYFVPTVKFEAATGNCEIYGESYLEDTSEFYTPVFRWVKEYFKYKSTGSLELKIKLSYFNTSSSRALSVLLQILKEYDDQGKDVSVVWYYKSNDDDMVEEIEDFMDETGLDIITYPVDEF